MPEFLLKEANNATEPTKDLEREKTLSEGAQRQLPR